MRSNSSAEAEAIVSDAPLPYEPSVPCARCARGVDPLRAPCVSATESRMYYFCGRACRMAFAAAELVHAEREPAPPRRPARSGPILRARSFEPISRRIEEAPVRVPAWPPVVAASATVASFFAAELLPLFALLSTIGACFLAHRSEHTRAAVGRAGSVAAPIAVALFGLAALEQPRADPMIAAAIAVIGSFLGERWLARASARLAAERAQLEARLPTQVAARDPARGNDLVDRPTARLRQGDEVRIDAPAVVPVDGVVIEGAGHLVPYPGAEAAIPRAVGSTVLAGALLTEGTLTLRATRAERDCVLRHALSTPSSLGLPAPLAHLLGDHPRAVAGTLAALTALLAFYVHGASPAALAALGAGWIALPLLLFARGPRGVIQATGITTAAHGVHLRARTAVDVLGRIDTVVVRVEGVLLEPDCSVASITSLSPSYDPATLGALALAAGAADETHPVSVAIAAHAAAQQLKPALLRRLARTEGRGITALTDGDGELVLGSRAALLAAGVSVAVADRQAIEAERAGRRVVFVAVGGRVRGFVQLRLTVRPDARDAMQALLALGIDVVLLASDHQATADAIAHVLGVPPGKAELTASQRAETVRHLRESDARLLVLGRHPHDDALFAAADASMCIDGAGHAVGCALATASPGLREAAIALAQVRRARHLVHASCALGALAAMLTLLAAGGLVPASAVALISLFVAWLALVRAPEYVRAPVRRAERAHAK